MKRYGFLIAFMAIILSLASCSQELAVTSPAEEDGIPVRFSVVAGTMKNASGVVTKSADLPTVSESEITNLWVVQFSSTGAYMKSSYHPTVNASVIDVRLLAGSNTHVYFFANWGDSILSSFSGTETTFSALTKTLTKESDVYYNGTTLSGKKNLPMASAMQTITVLSNGYVDLSASPVVMNYAVARIDLPYNITLPNFALRRIRVCNIPKVMELGAPAVATTTATYPSALTSSTVFNTNYTDVSSNTGTITYYVPENQRGQATSNTTELQKTGLSGDYPTYIDLVGYTTLNDSRGEIHYRMYPGADVIKDYNVVRSTQYTLTANLAGVSPIDGRITQLSLANSYIVAPGQSVYIPVKRANQSDLGIRFLDVTSGSLTTSIVWQSASGLVTPTMDNASGCIKVTAPSATATGNAVVAVKSGSTILWSWHVWVTGYDPNVTNMTQNGLVWMDRNLGAIAACTGSNTFDQCGGLFYQWGRKDPFPGVNSSGGETSTYYNGSTTATNGLYATANATTTGTSAPNYNLPLAIQNPSTFYYGVTSGNNGDWYTPGSSGQNNNLWVMGLGKTVYDPCPAGWEVPGIGSWTSSSWNLPSATTSYSNYAVWTLGGVNSYYPITGQRVVGTGSLDWQGSHGCYWYSTNTGVRAYFLYVDSGNANLLYFEYRAQGFKVRCVKE